METTIDPDLLEDIWNDAQFETTKNKGILSAMDIKKNSIRKIDEYNQVLTYCKVCNCEMKISCKYDGDYPLCYKHRNPNDRPLKLEKYKKKSFIKEK